MPFPSLRFGPVILPSDFEILLLIEMLAIPLAFGLGHTMALFLPEGTPENGRRTWRTNFQAAANLLAPLVFVSLPFAHFVLIPLQSLQDRGASSLIELGGAVAPFLLAPVVTVFLSRKARRILASRWVTGFYAILIGMGVGYIHFVLKCF